MELLKSELNVIKNTVQNDLHKSLTDDQAFEFLSCYLFCYKDEEFKKNLYNIDSSITNGPNDGGIDFVFYDEENTKIILGQCKYTTNFSLNDIISELNKMSSTLENFKLNNTGSYNDKLKVELQNAIDRLPDGEEGNVEFSIFALATFDEEKLNSKIDNEQNIYSKDMVNVYTIENFESRIKELAETIDTVPRYSINIDKAKNFLSYETDKVNGIMVNMSSKSLISLYNSFKDDGLLDMNIRKFVKNKIVDDGIKQTLDNDRDNFWFLNNGIIIACEDFEVDGNTVKIEGFSIVNGGQTTNRIGNYKGSNNEEFFIPCKIISINKNNPDLYSKIAEATNSQKPIYPRDLKANSPEMKMLQRWLNQEDIYLEIKRGQKKPNKKYKVKNDELGQLILSFIYQQPGTARSGKKTIFDNPSYYNKIYKQNYEKDTHKKEFIKDLIRLSVDYSSVEQELKNGTDLTNDQKNILKNAKFVVMSLIGVNYMIENRDIQAYDIINDPDQISKNDFVYDKFISNYKNDDYHQKLTELVKLILEILEHVYNMESQQNSITSVSNLFKRDNKYRESILKQYLQSMNSGYYKPQFELYTVILKR